jgi:hypothetical protein
MNRSHYEAMVYKVNKEIILLKEDIKHINHSGIKRSIENEISQKQTRVRILMEKAKTPAPPLTQKTLDKQNRFHLK